MAPALSQVIGIPIGLVLANNYGWHSPFWLVVFIGIITCVILYIYLLPVTEQMKYASDKNSFERLVKIIIKPQYVISYLSTAMLVLGLWLLMPFNAGFINFNAGISLTDLPFLYLFTGLSSVIAAPLFGKMSDRFGKFKVFAISSVLCFFILPFYTSLHSVPLFVMIVMNALLFMTIMARLIPGSTLVTGIPEPDERGAFMSINSSVQQLAGGVASLLAGLIVFQSESGLLENYNVLGFVIMGSVIVSVVLTYWVDNFIRKKSI
jgi:predicted MFS family arabinose efflux permease